MKSVFFMCEIRAFVGSMDKISASIVGSMCKIRASVGSMGKFELL